MSSKLCLFMWLFSLLFGCKEKSKDPYPDVPHFPETDNSRCQVIPVPMDTDFYAHAFIIDPGKQKVFVLAYGTDGPLDDMPYRLLRFGPDGKVEAQMEMPGSLWTEIPFFWQEEDGLYSLLLSDRIKTFDPVSLKIVKEWEQVDFQNFLTQKQFDQLTYDERDDAYVDKMRKAAEKARTGCVRPVLNLHFLMLEFPNKKPEAWHLRFDDEIAEYSQRFGLKKAAENPAPAGESEVAVDGNTRLALLDGNVLGYKIRYPDLKYTEQRIYELAAGEKKARFKLSNEDSHSLLLHPADNRYLTTADGTIWLMYERQLYRIIPG